MQLVGSVQQVELVLGLNGTTIESSLYWAGPEEHDSGPPPSPVLVNAFARGRELRQRVGASPAAYQATSEALAAQVVAAALPGLVLERFHELSQQSRPGGLLTLKVLLLHPRLQPVPWELLADSEALRSIAAPVVVWRGVRSERAFPPAPESSLLLLGSAPADVSSTHAEDEFRLIGEQFEARPESAPTRIHGYRSVR